MSDDRDWQALSVQETERALETNVAQGLTGAEVARRTAIYGPNRVRGTAAPTYLRVFLEEVREPMILLLIGTGILYAVWGQAGDAVTIFVVIALLVTAEVFTEYRAKNAIAALASLSEAGYPVLRDGKAQDVDTVSLVPGDIITVLAGRRVPADARLVQSYGLIVDESTLTGESAPVRKDAAVVVAATTPLAERVNMLYAGTVATGGRGIAAVVAVGTHSEVGRLASLAQEVKAPRTPLQEAMSSLTIWLAWVAIGISALVPFLAWALNGESPRRMVLTGLSLAFSIIPEELPIVVTMVLGVGAWHLARRHAIVKRLPAVETLGSVTVIVTDKTGTLTENRMDLAEVDPPDRRGRLLTIGTICNDAFQSGTTFTGDPMETAILRAADRTGIDRPKLLAQTPIVEEFSFDATLKLMSVVTTGAGGVRRAATKGAPEAVIAASTMGSQEQAAVRETAERFARKGFRVVAFAERDLPADVPDNRENIERNLTFVGLAAFIDPPRSGVKDAIGACRGAGIRPLLVSGDAVLTTITIAEMVGLDTGGRALSGPEIDRLSDAQLDDALESTCVVARSDPAHKLRIVRALQARSERVAVTGDGTNDAPALAAADIGIAMGETGTDVARDAASIVVVDDNFATIVNAIGEGRVLFDNVRKAIRYYLACKLALVSIVFLPVLLRAPVPFAPIQIILMELFMDVAASAAFVAEPAESDVMQRPPRDPKIPVMNRGMVAGIFSASFGLFAAVSVAYLVTWFSSGDVVRSQTMAFFTWLIGHVFLALVTRSDRDPLIKHGMFTNRVMTIWAAATTAFLIVVMFVPAIQIGVKATTLSASDVGFALGLAFLGTFWLDIRKLFRPLLKSRAARSAKAARAS